MEIKVDVNKDFIGITFGVAGFVVLNRQQYANLIDMLQYCATVASGVLVKRDLSNYQEIERPK